MGRSLAIDQITWSCRADLGKEPTLVKRLRITLIALGIIAIVTGVLILSGIPRLNQLGPVGGSIFLSSGALVTFVFSVFKGVKKEKERVFPTTLSDEKPSSIIPDTTPAPSTLKGIPVKETSPPIYISLAKLSTPGLPSWLSKLLPDTIPSMDISSHKLNDIVDAASEYPQCLVQFGTSVLKSGMSGLYLKVQVEHVNLDDKYDEKCKQEALQKKEDLKKWMKETLNSLDGCPASENPPSNQPFILHLVVYKTTSRLELATVGPILKHRHENQSMSGLLQHFQCSHSSEKLAEIEKQEDLPEGSQRSLEWLLSRLLQKGSVKVREDNDLMPDFTNPAVGKWEVSLVKQ